MDSGHSQGGCPIVYRHTDGYPEGAGKDLIRFLEICRSLNDSRLEDPEYLAARYVVFLAGIYTHGSERLDFLSVGVVSEDPGDIEYRDVVDCREIGKNGLPEVTCWHIERTNRREHLQMAAIPGYRANGKGKGGAP